MNTPLHAGQSLRRRRTGFTLVEVSIAMGIASVSLISVLGLLPLGSSSNRNTVDQTRAASIARTIVSDLRSTPSSGAASPLYSLTPVAGNGGTTLYFGEDSASPSSANTAASRYRATVTFSSVSGSVVGARVLLTWPAAAAPNAAAGNYEVFTMLGAN